MEKPSTKALREAVPDISSAYASMILSDSDDPRKSRTPSRSLAIKIFRETGWRHPSIDDLTEEQMALLEKIEPWTRRAQDEAA